MIYFFVYLFLETFVSVEIGSAIGPFWTFIEIVGSAFTGLLLLTNFRYTFFENVRAMLEGGMTPETFQKQNLSALIGAILLIIPGFLTDIVGVMLYFGVFTNLIVNRLSKRERYSDVKTDQFKEGEYDVIDVEIIERHDDRK